jgi:predicted transposase/invertase (TIGR01784 family)
MRTFINPLLDWAFRYIFGSDRSAGVLRDLLNALLYQGEEVISTVTILDPYLHGSGKGLKQSIVDVRAKTRDGRQFLVEMQMLPVSGFAKRLLYNGAKAFVSPLKRGGNYASLESVISICFCDYEFSPTDPKAVLHYELTERTSRQVFPANDLQWIVIQLPHFTKNLEELSDDLDSWLWFLRHASEIKSVPSRLKKHQVKEAFTMAKVASLNPEESEIMSKREMWKWDQINMRSLALSEGLEKGLEQGRWQLVGTLLQSLPPHRVAELCRLPVAEVEAFATKQGTSDKSPKKRRLASV